MRRLATGLAVTQTFLILSTALWATSAGCGKKDAPAPPPQAAAMPDQPAVAPDVPSPPAYKVPDTLPASATLRLVKQENGASIYNAVWSTPFAFDPKLADLGLDINTVGWAYNGKIVITNKDDDESLGSGSHSQLYPTQPPTTQGLDLPAEHLRLEENERQWVKAGGITIFIRNEDGATGSPPTVLSVDLVPFEK